MARPKTRNLNGTMVGTTPTKKGEIIVGLWFDTSVHKQLILVVNIDQKGNLLTEAAAHAHFEVLEGNKIRHSGVFYKQAMKVYEELGGTMPERVFTTVSYRREKRGRTWRAVRD